MSRPLLIAGPTASGKSALALALAERLGRAVVNADSQQVYAGWRILTARPSPEEEARAPHRLYGHVGMAAAYSAGQWLREVAAVLEADPAPIIVGGTGLYFKALTEGLAEIPPVPPAIRQAGEARLALLGTEGLAAEIAARDPGTAAGIDLANPARLLRAWEVLEATGRGLADWQTETPPPLLPLAEVTAIRLEPERDELGARCDARLDAMVAAGVLEEVAANRLLDLALPAMKAVGAPEFLAHLNGETTLDEALAAARTATRRYAKRQLTWGRNQMGAGWHVMATPDPDAVLRLGSLQIISPQPRAATDSSEKTD